MNRARSFLFVSLGVLAIAAAYHLGASTATAQSGSMVSGFTGTFAIYPTPTSGPYATGTFAVMTPNGDVYLRDMTSGVATGPAIFAGNFWAGGATSARQESFGQLKARYRGERAAVPQGATQPQRVDRR